MASPLARIAGLAAFGLAAFGLLAGCAGSLPVVTHEDLDVDFYQTSFINAASVDGALPATVVGAPVAGASAADSLAPLRLPATTNARRLIPGKDEGTRLVILFNPKAPAMGNRGCAEAGTLQSLVAPVPSTDGLAAQVILCQGRRQISSALSSGPAITGLSDPTYADTLSAAFVKVLPARAPIEFNLVN